MDAESFENLVADALEALPEFFRDKLDNVEVVVEDWPDHHTLRLARVRSPYGLLGFYHGVPLTERTSYYGLVAPDKISIYRRPIEAQCRTEDELRDTVRRVVLHELAHHFGISDNRLHEIGAY
jgi:predicted Zn-dependent protease with MMP-like domain